MALSSIQPSFVTPSLAIEGGLQYGYVITIQGTVLNSNGTRFAVDFKIGSSDSEIAFHFNPRFENGGYVVCNTKQKGWWGTEERTMMNPFHMGKPFEIRILVESAMFQRSSMAKLAHPCGGFKSRLLYPTVSKSI
ncbi:galectin-9B-like [Myotis lucifugus]|uniref:galectin-9B-like n=1 Tax=Myotis lucifugus TaxID=59463 RepID=UPI0006D7462D|nr:galectin-9B-like [Myotis lucifugus]